MPKLPFAGAVVLLAACMPGFCQPPVIPPSNGQNPPAKAGGKPGKAPLPPRPSTMMIPIVLNYHPVRGEMVVDGLVNRNNPAQFVIATGLNHSVVSPEDAARFELKPGEKKQKISFLDASVEGPIGTLNLVRLGAGTIQNMDVVHANLWPMLTRDNPAELPGCWIGSDLLSRYQVMLDFEQHTVILNKPDSPWMKAQGALVPFKFKNGRPMVRISAGSAGSFDAILDTGSMGTLIPASIASKIKGKKKQPAVPGVGMDVAGGKMTRTIVPMLSLGKATVKNLMAVSLGPNAKPGSDKSMAIIGQDFMRHFRIVISYTKQQLQILPPASQEKPEDPGQF
jgi:Aspartyl protease